MVLLGLITRLFTLAATVGAFLGARWLVATAAGVPGASIPFRRFAVPSQGVPRWARTAVAVAGPAAVYLVASVFFGAAIKLLGDVQFDQFDSTIDVLPGRPAALAGIRSGDRVLRVAGHPVSTYSDARALIGEPGRAGPLEIVVERDAAELTVMVQPGMNAGGPQIGITPHPHVVNVGIGTAIVRGLAYPAQFIAAIAQLLGGAPAVEGPITHAPSTSTTSSSVTALFLMGYLSLLVGVLLVPVALFGWRPRA